MTETTRTQTEVQLDAEMEEIVAAVVARGVATTTEEAILLALRSLWNDLQTTGDHQRIQAALQEAAADTQPGVPMDEVFARLNSRMAHMANVSQADAA